MTKVLVTGATGNVGSRVVKELAGRGVPVRAFVRDPDRAAAALGPVVELAVGDLADPASIQAALEGVERVFLACGNLPPQVAYETNLIDAAARAGVARLVKLSALGAGIGSPVDFWDWHARIEEHLGASEIPSVVLRPRYYMTNLLAFAGTVRAAGAVFAPAEGVKIPMIDPADVAATAAAVLTSDGHEGRTYELTGPESVTFHDVAAQLSEATGRPVQFVPVPDAAALDGLRQAGLPDWMATNIVAVFAMLRQDPATQVTDAVHALTARQPRHLSELLSGHAALFAPCPERPFPASPGRVGRHGKVAVTHRVDGGAGSPLRPRRPASGRTARRSGRRGRAARPGCRTRRCGRPRPPRSGRPGRWWTAGGRSRRWSGPSAAAGGRR